MSWESPIKMIVSDVVTKQEECLIRAIQSVGFNVNKEELEKALKYDREQYEKGYADAKRDLVRCKDCKHWLQRSAEVYRPVGIEGCACDSWIRITQENDYCSRGERKDGKID